VYDGGRASREVRGGSIANGGLGEVQRKKGWARKRWGLRYGLGVMPRVKTGGKVLSQGPAREDSGECTARKAGRAEVERRGNEARAQPVPRLMPAHSSLPPSMPPSPSLTS
jgi:hypothetical protein